MNRLADILLAWFDCTARDLPWRHDRTPYRVWLAEIMLQQTQVATVIPYYERFLRSWPDFTALARADEEQVLKAWEGLGYYSRARNLHRAAIQVMDSFSGVLPADERLIRSLPGIGEYTAGAIGSIAFNLPVAAVDGNVVRVFARLDAVAWNPADPADRRLVRQRVEAELPPDRPGDFNEALMDLGATVCLPRNPVCQDCPLAPFCQARMLDRIDEFPARKQSQVILAEERTVLVLHQNHTYHVKRRPVKGMLAGLYEFDWLDEYQPTADITAAFTTRQISDQSIEQAIEQTIEQTIAQRIAQGVQVTPLPVYTHRFTHRIWNLTGYLVDLPDLSALISDHVSGGGRWVSAAELASLPFPTALERYRQAVLSAEPD